MAQTKINPVDQIPPGSLTRSLLNTATAGSALITKVIAGTNVTLTNTGIDAGTGDVTVNVATLDNAAIGLQTPSTGAFTTVDASSAFTYGGADLITAQPTLYNYFFGPSGNLTMTGGNNTAIGRFALEYNTTASYNLAVGGGALRLATTGGQNVALGISALTNSQTGSYNTSLGVNSGFDLGQSQVATALVATCGYTILTLGTTDFTLIGAASNTVGLSFVATGAGAGTGTATPSVNYNTFVGHYAGGNVITGNNNTIIGAEYKGSANLTGAIVLATGDGVDQLDYNVTTAGAWTMPSASGTVLHVGTGAGSSTTPSSIDFDSSTSSVPGQNLKLKLYASSYGIGVSSGQLDLAGGNFAFWNAANKTAAINTVGSLSLGYVATPTATAAPITIAMDQTYSSVAGAHPKLNLYQGTFGLGVSASQLDVISGGATAFWSSATKIAAFDNTGILTLAGLAGMTTPLSVAQGGTGGASFALSALSDVNVSEIFPENQTALVWEQSNNKWTQVPLQLAYLTDCNVSEGQGTDQTFLQYSYSANAWVQTLLTSQMLTDFKTGGANTGDTMIYNSMELEWLPQPSIESLFSIGAPVDLGVTTYNGIDIMNGHIHDLGTVNMPASNPGQDLGLLTQPTIAGVPFGGASIKIPLVNLSDVPAPLNGNLLIYQKAAGAWASFSPFLLNVGMGVAMDLGLANAINSTNDDLGVLTSPQARTYDLGLFTTTY